MTADVEVLREDAAALVTVDCEASFHSFVQEAWSTVVPGEPLQDNWHVEAICDHLQALYAREFEGLLINVPPRHGKPLSVETLVLMGDGSRKRLGDVSVGDRVISHRGRACRVSAVYDQGVLPVVTILLHSGRSVTAAFDHPFLTPEGFVEAGKLAGKTCANVAAPSTIGAVERDEDDFWIAGYLVGDGSVSAGSFGLSATDPVIRADFTARVMHKGWRVRATKTMLYVKKQSGMYRSAAKEWLRASELSGKTSYTKRVPTWVFLAPSAFIAAFLAGYFMTDGWVDRRGRPGIASVSEMLMRDTQHLLLRLGVQSTLRKKFGSVGARKVRQVGIRYISWELSIQGSDAAARFASIVPLFGAKAIRLCAVATRSQFDTPLFADDVVSVSPTGEVDCKCLAVEQDATFTANDVVVHNSILCCVMFPAWLWIKDPAFRMIYASYSQTFAMRDSRETHRLISSEWYQRQWGDKYRLAEDADAQVRFETDKRGFRIATSIGGLGTGEGGDLIGVDDPHKADEVASDVQRQIPIDWWNVTMQTRTGRLGRTLRLIVMQRLHEMDLSGDIIERGGYIHLVLPQEYEPVRTKLPTKIGWRDPRTEDGALLWPERWPAEKIQAEQKPPRLSTVVYAGQYQQRPAPAEGGMFLRKLWKYYKVDVLSLLEGADDSCWSWDFAFKDLKSSDFVAGTAWARRGANFYLLPHTVHDKLAFSASKAALRSCAAMWPQIHVKLVEDKANGTAIVEDLQHTVPGLKVVDPRGGKESRASAMQAYLEAGNLWLPDPSVAGWVEQYVEEFRVFPNGRNDDWVDSSSQAVTWLLDRMLRGFAPFTVAFNRSTSRAEVGMEQYRDPRESPDIQYVKKTDRTMDPLSVQHDVESVEHRSECRACRVAWRTTDTKG